MKQILFLIALILSSICLNAQTQPRLVLPIGHTSYIYSAVFSPDGKLALTASFDGTSRIYEAAGGQESALEAITVEGKSIENGAFSYCVLGYLKNNSNNPEELTVNKLKNYVEKRVEEITNGKQQATSRQETMEVDWSLR